MNMKAMVVITSVGSDGVKRLMMFAGRYVTDVTIADTYYYWGAYHLMFQALDFGTEFHANEFLKYLALKIDAVVFCQVETVIVVNPASISHKQVFIDRKQFKERDSVEFDYMAEVDNTIHVEGLFVNSDTHYIAVKILKPIRQHGTEYPAGCSLPFSIEHIKDLKKL